MNETQFRKTLKLKPRMVNLWSNIIKYSVAACIVGIVSFGVYRYHEYNKTVSLGNSQYMAYVSDISEVGSSRGQESETIRKELVELFKNVEEGIEIKSTIEALELLYVESYAPNSPYNNFLDDISWNLAIAYLKYGEREKSILILENMIIRNTNYPEITQPVQKLIDQIKDL
jgi:hypothetical protein